MECWVWNLITYRKAFAIVAADSFVPEIGSGWYLLNCNTSSYLLVLDPTLTFLSLDAANLSFPESGYCKAINEMQWPTYKGPTDDYKLHVEFRSLNGSCGGHVRHVGFYFNYADEENFDHVFIR